MGVIRCRVPMHVHARTHSVLRRRFVRSSAMGSYPEIENSFELSNLFLCTMVGTSVAVQVAFEDVAAWSGEIICDGV